MRKSVSFQHHDSVPAKRNFVQILVFCQRVRFHDLNSAILDPEDFQLLQMLESLCWDASQFATWRHQYVQQGKVWLGFEKGPY